MAQISINIKTTNSSNTPLSIETSATVLELKQKVAEVLEVPAANQRLIYKGKVLKDDLTLESYEVQDGHTVHMVKGAVAGATPASARPAAAAAPAAPAAAEPAGMPGAANPMANPFANPFGGGGGMGAMGGFGGMGVGGDINRMQQQLMENPEMMSSLMNSPMMQNMMNNPDIMRNMMLNNPQMQAILDANPQMRHVLNDPAILRQSMEMMRNPHAMREAMRSQDLQMSQIENLPGGFNALRNMFEGVQEPMMNAMQSTPQQQQPSNAAPPSQSTQPGGSLPNPWGAPAPPAAGQQQQQSPFGAGGANPFAGMMGGGMGGMGMGAAGADPMAMLNDPAMQQMYANMMADPAMLEMMAAQNPQIAGMLQNPATRAMLTNPEAMRRMMDPNVIRATMQMQEAMRTLQQAGVMPPIGGAAGGMNPYGGLGAPAGGLDFAALLNGGTGTFGGAGAFGGAPAAPQQDPAVRFAAQLQQLRDMGFSDDAASLRALQATSGNVNAAVERLLGGM